MRQGAGFVPLAALPPQHPKRHAAPRPEGDPLVHHAAGVVVGVVEDLELEPPEEPVAAEHWPAACSLPLPFALDETLRDGALCERLLKDGHIRAVVLKPMVIGGFRASFEIAERAAAYGASYLVSHTFDGPIARAATAELALALQTELAAGIGAHPALELWPPHRLAAESFFRKN